MPDHDSTDALLELRDVSVSYGKGQAKKLALDGATLTISRGEAVGVIGETGSGKTTLARVILGLVKSSGGSLRVAGSDVTTFSASRWKEFRRSGVVQYVFQDPLRSLDPDRTVEESIAEPLQIRGGQSRDDIAATVRLFLARVNLDETLLERFPGELSGGQRQRVAIARALVTEPQLLILDEPVSALDSANRVQVLELLKKLRSPQTSLLFISHDLGSVAGITDRVVVLYRGSVVEIDDTRTIVNNPSHPYTRLLVGSAPTLSTGSIDRARREELRAELQQS